MVQLGLGLDPSSVVAIFLLHCHLYFAISALTLLVDWHKGHPPLYGTPGVIHGDRGKIGSLNKTQERLLVFLVTVIFVALKILPNSQHLQDGEGWATGPHLLLITLLFVCEKWMRTSTRPSLGGCARLSLTWGLGCPVGVGGRALPWGVGPAGHWVCALGKYLDPTGDRISMAPA